MYLLKVQEVKTKNTQDSMERSVRITKLVDEEHSLIKAINDLKRLKMEGQIRMDEDLASHKLATEVEIKEIDKEKRSLENIVNKLRDARKQEMIPVEKLKAQATAIYAGLQAERKEFNEKQLVFDAAEDLMMDRMQDLGDREDSNAVDIVKIADDFLKANNLMELAKNSMKRVNSMWGKFHKDVSEHNKTVTKHNTEVTGQNKMDDAREDQLIKREDQVVQDRIQIADGYKILERTKKEIHG